VVQADEKLVFLSAQNDFGSSKELKDSTETGEGENGGQKCELLCNLFFFFFTEISLGIPFSVSPQWLFTLGDL